MFHDDGLGLGLVAVGVTNRRRMLVSTKLEGVCAAAVSSGCQVAAHKTIRDHGRLIDRHCAI